MLVQTCPAPGPTSGLVSKGGYLGGLSCGAIAEQAGKKIAILNIPITSCSSSEFSDDSSSDNTDRAEDVRDVSTKEEIQSCVLSDSHLGPSVCKQKAEGYILQLDSDLTETETQILDIETTVTETFTVRHQERFDDSVTELMVYEGDLLVPHVSNHSLQESEVLRVDNGQSSDHGQLSINTDIYSENFEQAFQSENTGNRRIFDNTSADLSSTFSPNLMTSVSSPTLKTLPPCHTIAVMSHSPIIKSSASSPTIKLFAPSPTLTTSQDKTNRAPHAFDSPNPFQKTNSLDKTTRAKDKTSIPTTTTISSPQTELMDRSSGHRVTFNSQNEVASQDRDGTFQVTYRQLGEKIKVRNGKTQSPSAQRVQFHDKSHLLEPAPVSGRIEMGFDRSGENEEIPRRLEGMDTRSSDEWDNPFQPEGEVSQEAELILRLWKDGQKVTEENIKRIMAEEDNIKKVIAEEENIKKVIEKKENIKRNIEDKGESNEEKEYINNKEGHPTRIENVDRDNNVSYPSKSLEMCSSSTKNGKGMVTYPTKEQKEKQESVCYPVTLTGNRKHKDKLKKHCSMM